MKNYKTANKISGKIQRLSSVLVPIPKLLGSGIPVSGISCVAKIYPQEFKVKL